MPMSVLGKQFLTHVERQCVGAAIAVVQAGGMPALAPAAPGFERDFAEFLGHGYDFDFGAVQQDAQFAAACWTLSRFDHNRRFEQVGRAEQTFGLGLQCFDHLIRLRLTEQNGDQGGGINDHLFLARQSVRVKAEDFFRRPRVEIGKSGAAAANLA